MYGVIAAYWICRAVEPALESDNRVGIKVTTPEAGGFTSSVEFEHINPREKIEGNSFP
jgi:hypothetical protein